MIRKPAAALAALSILIFTAPAIATEMASHRAFYRLSMGTLSADSDITDAQGAISYEIRSECDGWIVEQRYATTFLWANGRDSDTSDTYTSWESRDGREYQFNVKRFLNGEETKRISGRAELESKGGPGVAYFDEPSAETIQLPAGTVFPTDHTILLIEKARKGEKFDRHLVFDGSEVEGAAPISTIILNSRPAEADSLVKEPLGPSAVWPMKLAFYAAEGKAGPGEELPHFELSIDMQENGVATVIVLKFDGFEMVGKLESIEAIPEPQC